MSDDGKWFRAGCLIVSLGLLGACDEGANGPQTFLAEPGPVPAEPQRPGDPEVGYRALLDGDYVSCGIPYSAYRQVNGSPKPEELIPGREGRNRELPYFSSAHVSAGGVELISNNCLLCHAGFIDGRLVIGLGNEFLDFTDDASVNAERLGAYVQGERDAAEWRRWADRIAAIAPYIMTDTIGANPAIDATLALMAHHDRKTMAWSQTPLMAPPPGPPLPVSVPPWWNMRKKNALFYSTEGRGDHARIIMLAATLCTDDLEETRRIDGYAPHIRAYLASLEPPAFPYEIDRTLAESGREVFEARCSRCHGTYGENASYPNLVVGYEAVGTDPELAKGAVHKETARFRHWFNESFYGETARAEPAPGYIAPPLDGVWATAPYLHNGSVPTIEALLDSRKRPKYWLHPLEPAGYDRQALGWNFTEVNYGKEEARDADERKRLYDTTRKGYSNAGHRFGDSLSGAQRRALIEYLKTL